MVRALAALLLAAPAWASAAGAAAVPQICTGWPSPDAPHVAATNYSNADLPDLLTLLNGSRVTSAGPLWEARRAEIKHLLHRYFYGTLPDETPPLTNVSTSAEVAVRGGLSQQIELTFLVLGKTPVTFTVELIRPAGPGPYPLFLTQSNHRRWGIKAVARGYAACIYPGADVNDQSLHFRAACKIVILSRFACCASR